MKSVDKNSKNSLDRSIEQEIRGSRTGSFENALLRESGDFLKGGSPVPLLLQAETEISLYINRNVPDKFGALREVLIQHVKRSKTTIAATLDTPLLALKKIIVEIITHDNIFYDFVREVDSAYGRLFQEKPYFQKPGEPPHPEDEYTHESVKIALTKVISEL
jgi:hypothetical protein